MSFDPFTAGFDLVKTGLDKFFPDADAKLKGQLDAAAASISNEYNLQLGQLQANTEQAKHASVFVAGARPAAMWVGVFALAYSSIGVSLLSWVALCFGLPPVPPLASEAATGILTSLLGLGAMRSYDKIKGTDTKAVGK